MKQILERLLLINIVISVLLKDGLSKNRIKEQKSACFINLALKTVSCLIPCPLHKGPHSKYRLRIWGR